MDRTQKDGRSTATPSGAQPNDAAAGKAPKEMYTDEYIRLWEPLDPLDPDRMTEEHRMVILEKMYRRNAVVYDRLAQL